MKTSSLWGKPPSRYYRLLRRIEEAFPSRALSICILGCSDGKFVLPAARRGHQVLAVDIDGVALFGGVKRDLHGDVYMSGLQARLKMEDLSDMVQVTQGDFVLVEPKPPVHQLVFTSGAIQYSYNLRHQLDDIITSTQAFVAPQGYLYFDYMLPSEAKHLSRENFLKPGRLRDFFPDIKWRVLYDRIPPPVFEAAHVDNPVDHYHHWGHLLAQRI